jgi:hypothetical protein
MKEDNAILDDFKLASLKATYFLIWAFLK